MYYGYKVAAALWVFYGLTLGMKAGAWGYFAPVIMQDLGLSATDIGLVAGVVFGGTAVFVPIAGAFILRFGCRASMIIGLILGAAGIALTALSTPVWQFALGGVLLAASTSFGGVVPIQTLTTYWFDKYRARAMAIIFTATPVWGALSYPAYAFLMEYMSWRGAIMTLAVIFPLGYLLILLVIRNRPEDVGEVIDGHAAILARSQSITAASDTARIAAGTEIESRWTSKTALLSPAFAVITINVVVCTLPYLYFTTYGRMLVEAKGVATEVAVTALAGLTLATLVGRLCASLADFIDANVMMITAMLCNVAGMVLIQFFDSPALINVSVFLMGWSFGLSFLLAPILLAKYFGRKVFASVEATRMGLVVGINACTTPLFGYIIDQSNSYFLPLQVMLVVHAIAIAIVGVYALRPGRLARRLQGPA